MKNGFNALLIWIALLIVQVIIIEIYLILKNMTILAICEIIWGIVTFSFLLWGAANSDTDGLA